MPGAHMIHGGGAYQASIDTMVLEPDSGDPSAQYGDPGGSARDPSSLVAHVTQLGPPELGPPNNQPFQSGHTSIVPTNPASEQGVGRAPGWQWAHYPHVQQFNVEWVNGQTLLLDGQDPQAMLGPGAYRAGRSPIWLQALENYRQLPDQKHVWPAYAVVNQPPSQTFTDVTQSATADGDGTYAGGW